MAEFFLRRPVFATVCALLIILAGAVSIPTLPVEWYPTLAPPQVSVISAYTGANAQTVETAVTIPLEQQINGAEGMRYLTSTSGNNGLSNITAVFELDRNIDLAAVDVQNRVSIALGRLPNEVKATGVSVAKASNAIVLVVGVYCEHNEYDTQFMSNYVDVYMRDSLKRIKGVSDVQIFAERRYAMRVWLDPVLLASRSLTATDVLAALREQNVEVAAGQVGQPPVPSGQGFEISVRVVGRLSEPAEFGNIIVKAQKDGGLVKLRDLGTVELGSESYDSNLSFGDLPAVGFGVFQLPSANALEVDRAVKEELLRLRQRFPPGLKGTIAFDTTTVVGESIREVLITLVQAIFFVILVIFVFLQDWRTTLIPAITIPVSLVGTFALVKVLGFSINTLTLFGLTLATGLVVDDAIVVIENIQRHIRDSDLSVMAAASVAMREITGAVVATSLVLVSVFVPVAFFPGTTGLLYKQFSLTIACSVAISMFNALTLTPALSALWLRREEVAHRGFFGLFNRGVTRLNAWYRRTLERLERRRWWVVAAFLCGLALTFWIFIKVPTSFVPDEDQDYLIVVIQAPPGASLDYTTGIAKHAIAVLRGTPEVQSVFAVTGFSFTGSAPNAGLMFAGLKPLKERPGPEHSAQAVVGRLFGPLMGGISGALVLPLLPPSINGLGIYGGFAFEVLDQSGSSVQALADATQAMLAQGRADPKLQSMYSSYTANDPQLLVTIDREKAKSLGVPLSQIDDTLQVLLGSSYVNDFNFNNRSYRVYVQAAGRFRTRPGDVRQFYVRSDRGGMVALDNLVAITETTGPQLINHFNLFRSATITGAAAPGYGSGEAIAEMEKVAKKAMPQGFGYQWSGLSLEEIRSGGQSALLFGLGLLVVYLTLSAQYESFTLPFIILLAVPLAIFGALSAAALRGIQDNVYVQIGLVMLIGLAAKNSILIVEFAEQLRGRGHGLIEAAIEAARIRLRPILMTSFAFILGVLPLVFATGAGKEGRHSVGTAVFGGMLVSTVLNLVIIPVLYVIIRSIFPGGGRPIEAAAGEPGPAPAPAGESAGAAGGNHV
ncbi:MAG TPA: multidrug efflux RND transporter permease subunit [Thermoanaerobaculia bacterium]|nr:multidrug efflux RND transporter permease subunit [Thermoanaerobaculia bacterium]